MFLLTRIYRNEQNYSVHWKKYTEVLKAREEIHLTGKKHVP